MKKKVFESSGVVVPFVFINHIEKVKDNEGNPYGLVVVTSNTKWNMERGQWENNAFVDKDNMDLFLKEYEEYIGEIKGT